MTSSFAEFGLTAELARALESAGYTTPTPIQAAAIPHLLQGRDIVGLAQTGTGKTAAFTLPILQALTTERRRLEPRTIRALILAPTRELAVQIHESVRMMAKGQKLFHATAFGGVSINPQIDALRRGLDILVATPGRLVDLLNQKHARLDQVEHFVLDEADRMLDMGFIRDIRRILALLPKERQSMLFSATMPETIDEIAATLLDNPVRVEARTEAVPVDRIDQRIVHLPAGAKRAALVALLSAPDVTRAMVFARTKHGANRLGDHLEASGIEAEVIHGNKSQAARQKALNAFKNGHSRILVATDIAARGIDVANVSHVINAELPDEPESYVHRIGRTARAGKLGVAITLCDPSERQKLRSIERLTKKALAPMTIEGLDLSARTPSAPISDSRQPGGNRSGANRSTAARPAPRRDDGAEGGAHGRDRAMPIAGARPNGERPSERRGHNAPRGPRPAREPAAQALPARAKPASSWRSRVSEKQR
jgi:ATP-dependent RNA helicase RhlE